MLSLGFEERDDGLKCLFLGAHCDDIEIGCGGTILRLMKEYKITYMKWIVFTSNSIRAKEAIRSAEYFLEGTVAHEIVIKDFKDGFLTQFYEALKTLFESEKQKYDPDLIFTHYHNDRHQDHRLISDLTWNTFRDHLILEYEILKYDGDLGNPNYFVRLEKDIAEKKVKAILDHFPSQSEKHWFTADTFLSLMRVRGVASGTQYAEAFYGHKLIV